jgi:cytoskeletal protein RodZ
MSADDEWKRATRGEWLVAVALIAAGMAISVLAMGEIRASKPSSQIAQATQPQQSAPPEKSDEPAESKPGGTRPTTPAPEPANADPKTQKKASPPMQPQRPAEKYGAPIKER